MSNAPQYYEDEFSLDIGKYIEMILRQWRLILAITILFALAAAAFSLLAPKSYQASTLVASTRSASNVSFGTAINTLTEEELLTTGNAGYRLIDPETRMNSYVAMVKNPAIAEQILAEMRDEIYAAFEVDAAAGEEFTASDLLEQVEGSIAEKSDSIQITVMAPDPALAAKIANAWGQAYEEHVNTLYSGTGETSLSFASIQRQADEAKAEYDAAQAGLVEFRKNDRTDELERQINDLQTAIDTLSAARNTAVQSVVNDLTAKELEIINGYFGFISSNQMMALTRDRQGRTELLTSYIDTLSEARQLVFDEQANDTLVELSRKYGQLRQAELLLTDAQDMREQVQQGGEGAALSNSLALTVLKVKIFAATGQNQELLIQSEPILLSASAILADLDGLTATLATRIETLEGEIESLSQALIQGNGFAFLDAPLDPEGELALAIQERYAELWETGSLTALANETADGSTPLEQEAMARVEALLQFESLEDRINFNTQDSQQIQDLEAQVRELKSQLEIEHDRLKELARARDLTWATYTQLATKAAELGVASQTGGASVTLAVPAAVPTEDTVSGASNVLLASAVGFFLGIGLAFAIELWWNYKNLEPVVITPRAWLRGDLKHMQPKAIMATPSPLPPQPGPDEITYPPDC